jgi:hypothetical protein
VNSSRTIKLGIAAVFAMFFCSAANAQLANIDRAKLPQDQSVQAAYSNLLPVESFAQNWSPNWTFATPKAQVLSTVNASLKDMQAAQSAAPENVELLLATGLTAHFAYNLDVEADYEVAEQSLERAKQLAPADFRSDWFLGLHYCQATEQKKGMELFIGVEDRLPAEKLPVPFWDDYITCALVSGLPARALRAISRAENLGAPPAKYTLFAETARKHYTTTDAQSTYPTHDAWLTQHEGPDVRFQSELCGLGFLSREPWHVGLKDFDNGTCIETIETGPYPSKSGVSAPMMLLLTRAPRPDETLNDFVAAFLKKYQAALPITAPSCPSEPCVAFEVVTDTTYKDNGGAHFLAVGFAAKQPEFPGLLFEPIAPPPTATASKDGTYYAPNPRLTRLPGVLYTLVILDSNAAIFKYAEADFQYLLRSLQVD